MLGAAIASSLLVAAPAPGHAQGVALAASRMFRRRSMRAAAASASRSTAPTPVSEPRASPSRSCLAATARGRRSERSLAPAVRAAS